MDKNLKNNIWFLIFCFFVLPLVLSLVLVWRFDSFLNNEFVERFIVVSGYLFTLCSLILVFILFKTFKVSDYKRSVANKNFLEKDASDKLVLSLTIIKDCVNENEVENLFDSCTNVKNIYNSLKIHESDVDLKAYSNEIKSVFSLLNRYSLSSIGYESDVEKLKSMSMANKHSIVLEVDGLLWQLEQRSSLNEN